MTFGACKEAVNLKWIDRHFESTSILIGNSFLIVENLIWAIYKFFNKEVPSDGVAKNSRLFRRLLRSKLQLLKTKIQPSGLPVTTKHLRHTFTLPSQPKSILNNPFSHSSLHCSPPPPNDRQFKAILINSTAGA